ncbi:MAG: hypothetical protein KIS66_16920 [Fimbriimonadaceae bacterium]|nr:hypothetical protein [Fimbriimonadaceae bacterium]
MRKPLASAALLLLALAACAVQDAVSLRLKLDGDQKSVYKIVSKMVQNTTTPMGDMEMKIDTSMTLAMETGKAGEDGKAPLKMTASDIKMKLDSPMPVGEMPEIKDIVTTAKINGLGVVSDLKAEGVGAQMAQMLGSQQSSYFVVFPEKALAIGDSWEYKIPAMESFGIKESVMSAKLLKLADYKGKPAYQVSVKGKILMEGDPSKMAGAMGAEVPFQMKVKGTTGMDMILWVDPQTGRTFKMESTMDNDQQIEIIDMNMTVTSKGKGTYTMELVG